MNHNNIGLLAYGLATGLIEGDYLNPIGIEDEHIDIIFKKVSSLPLSISKQDVYQYFKGFIHKKEWFDALNDKDTAIALADVSHRAKPVEWGTFHTQIPEIIQKFPVTRGEAEAFVTLLANAKTVPAVA